jgi:FdrA protein
MHRVCRILKNAYFDSVVLMGAAARVKARDAVEEAAFFMGTPANKRLLEGVGFASSEVDAAAAGDALLCIAAHDATTADAALDDAVAALTGRKQATETGSGTGRPRGLSGALRAAQVHGGANLALISLPGRYVESEAMRALKRGLNVFIFSDNVPLAAEVRLKTEAVTRDLLCMGPDCGTAWIGGVGLGFCNEVPRGRVGIISASGTGLQAIACMLAARGEGISHGIGVGGRDLSFEVAGRMTLLALRRLEADPGTEAIIIVSKPPAQGTLSRLEQALAASSKPVAVACLGAAERSSGRTTWVTTLADAVDATVAGLRNETWQRTAFSDPAAARDTVARLGSATRGKSLLGVYTGGTLAHEAEILLQPMLGELAYGDETAIDHGRHCIVDLGDDQYTQGRPHPMIDPLPRAELLARQGGKAGVALFDLVLGRCSHPDPAAPLAEAIRMLRARLGDAAPVFVGAVVGTQGDSQNRAKQEASLRDAGAIVLPDNAQASRLAACLLAPEKAASLLAAA